MRLNLLITTIVTWVVVLGLIGIKLPYISKLQPSRAWAVPIVIGIIGGAYMEADTKGRYVGPLVPAWSALDSIVRALTFNMVQFK